MTKCPAGTILNPKTKICVLKDGRVGKRILLEQKLKRRSPQSRSRKKCPPGTILNPKTKICVLKDGRVGKSILLEQKLKRRSPQSRSRKKCPPGTILNPETKICVLKDGKVGKRILLEQKLKRRSPQSRSRKKCPPGTILNPETKICVLKDGRVGKRILLEKKLKRRSPQSSTKKGCPSDKILNPKTQICVLKDGRVGKRILLEQKLKGNLSSKSSSYGSSVVLTASGSESGSSTSGSSTSGSSSFGSQVLISSNSGESSSSESESESEVLTISSGSSSLISPPTIIKPKPNYIRRPPLTINITPTIINPTPDLKRKTPDELPKVKAVGPGIPSKFFPVVEDCDLIKNWKKIRKVGKGAYGTVFLVSCEVENIEYALKIQKNDKSFLTEIQALSELQKTNTVPKIFASWTCRNEGFIIMEKLKEFQYSKFSHDEIWRKVGNSLDKINKAGWLHVDTHDENVMCTVDNNIVIIDFGFAVKRTKLGESQTYPNQAMSAKNWYNFPLSWEFLESIQNYNFQTSFNPFYLSYDLVKAKKPTKEQKKAFEISYKNYYNGRKLLCAQGCKYAC
jgi:serine/threonine protein kinase